MQVSQALELCMIDPQASLSRIDQELDVK